MDAAVVRYDYERFARELGVRVKRLRKERGLSQRRLIVEHGFHLNQLHRIETGQPIALQTLLRLCAAFDLRLEELVKDLGLSGEPGTQAESLPEKTVTISEDTQSKKRPSTSKQKVAK